MAQDKTKVPKVPDGWLAKFDDKYSTWFYVNLSTKKSQWEPPNGTTFDSQSGDDVPPPAYSPNGKDKLSKPLFPRAAAPLVQDPWRAEDSWAA